MFTLKLQTLLETQSKVLGGPSPSFNLCQREQWQSYTAKPISEGEKHQGSRRRWADEIFLLHRAPSKHPKEMLSPPHLPAQMSVSFHHAAWSLAIHPYHGNKAIPTPPEILGSLDVRALGPWVLRASCAGPSIW